MAYTKEQIQQQFQSQFNVSTWTDFIINFFKAQTLMRVPEPLDIKPEEGTGYYWGKLSTSDTYEISFFYLKMNSAIDRRKVGLRQLIEKYIKIESDAGIAVFDDGNHWRLSFITDMRGEKTSPKRFTFVFGDPENHYLTPVTRFLELQRKGISYANIRDAFSVEALTKQFYNDLFDWYTWALDPTSGVYFPNNPNTPEDDRDKLDTKMIRLITRLMFVWFIKQKKDANGNGLVPEGLFDPEELKLYLKDFDPQSMTSGNYYQAILQNLFFATLNRPIKTVTYDKDGNEHVERRCFATNKDKPDVKSKYRYQELFKINEDRILSLFEFIPFINGGLFECLDKNKTSDGVERAYFHDGFSRNDTIVAGHFTKRAFVPNKLFFDPEDGIISIFRRYNFTVEENSPSEQLVALDPELLGKVFENLLGVYNPETQDTARNQSGSFYTPREIVNYMVDISLEAYLGNTDEVKALFADDFEYDEKKKSFYEDVIKKLKTIKVLDPACGSGAFPMGMLNRIVEILQNLHAEGNKYDLKLAIMENCIFGGDIQTIAAQITKLRFFISLVCDCKKNDNPDDNFGIPNLPNLETHFVTADSLIALKRPQQQNLFEQDVIELQKRLQQVRHEHFMAKTVYQKTKLRNRDKELRDELIEMLKSDNVIASENAYQMAKWNPYDQNGQSPFFDPKWMFGIEEGFDLVIGNPPYRRLQDNGGELANKYMSYGYETFDGNGDIYCLFYERGWQLLKKEAHLCFITSNKWMRAGYGEKVRAFFSKKVNPMLLIDFAGVKIFESATVDTNILLFAKSANMHHTICAVTNKQNKDSINNLSVFVQQQNSICNFNSSESWVILSPIEQSIKRKIESVGTPLKDWNIQINYGIKTGFNDAFIITTEKRNEILANCRDTDERQRTEELIRPILRGRDIKRYGYDWANLYLIATFPSCHYDIDRFPAVRNYLLSFSEVNLRKAGLGWIADNYLADFCKQKLSQTGKFIEICGKRVTIGATAEKARKKTNNKWFETQDSISYWEDFSKPKVMWKIIGCNINFCFDEKQLICNNAVNIMVGDRDNLVQFVGLMNSKLFDWYLKLTTEAEVQGGGIQLYVTTLEKTLLKLDFKQTFTDIIYQRIKNQVSDDDVNKAVFEVYRLTTEEQSFILQDRRVNRNRED